jgi:hypothetical protein
MALSKSELRAAVELLKEQARIQQELSGSLGGYIEGVKKVNAIFETVNENRKIEKKLEEEILALTSIGTTKALEDAKIAQQKLDLLKKQTNELKKHGIDLKKNLAEVKKGNLIMAKMGAIGVKTFAKLPDLVKNSYGQIRESGLFEMDKAMKTSALQMGVLSKQTNGFRGGIKTAALETTKIGIGLETLSKIQSDYGDELGRNVMLGEQGLIAMGEMAAATILGAEGAAKMAAEMETQGYSAERTRDFVEQTMDDAHKMGLNASKVIKNIQNNIKLLNKYNFKGGIKGLAKMAQTASKLGVDMNMVSGMADKLFDIEGAVDMSAQLQVMGGAWARLADPFKLMYMARNDMEGLMEMVGKAAESAVHFNSKTKDFEISALEMHRLRKIAEQTGVSYEELAQAGKNAAKFTKIKSQVAFTMSDEEKEFLATTAKLNEKGEASIIIDGKPKLLKQLSNADRGLLKQQILEKATLKQRAEEARTFDDALTNTFNMFKVLLLPLVETINDKLLPKIDEFVKRFQDGKWGEKISNFAKMIGKMVSFFGGWMLDNPIKTAFIYGAAKIADKASWILNGVMLAKGFNMSAMFPGSKHAAGKELIKKHGSASAARAARAAKAPKWGAAGGYGIGGMAVGLGTSMATESLRESGKEEAADAVNVLGSMGSGALTGAAIASVIPIPAISQAVGAIVGAAIGGGMALYGNSLQKGESIHDGYIGSDFSKRRGVIQGGKITPIDNKDDLIAMKPKGVIDNSISNKPDKMKIEFSPIEFKFDELRVTSPGSPSVAIDLLKDPQFIRNITRMVHVETEKVINGGVNKG